MSFYYVFQAYNIMYRYCTEISVKGHGGDE